MCEVSPELPSVIQEAWDRRRQRGGIMLFLCGSYLGFMEREVLGKKSPLFGRRTGQILLRPFDHTEAALFHPQLSLVDQAKTYFICGGLPFYLKCFSAGRSVEQNIADNFLSETGLLRREADFLLREELRELVNYHSILMAMAEEQNTNSGISAASGTGRCIFTSPRSSSWAMCAKSIRSPAPRRRCGWGYHVKSVGG
jgi:uncharacterized protein